MPTETDPQRGSVMSAVWDTYTRGTAVEYFHVATRAWLPATVESYSPGSNAYVLRTENGDTDMSSAPWTRPVSEAAIAHGDQIEFRHADGTWRRARCVSVNLTAVCFRTPDGAPGIAALSDVRRYTRLEN